jgi:hypothetical protein
MVRARVQVGVGFFRLGLGFRLGIGIGLGEVFPPSLSHTSSGRLLLVAGVSW